MNIKELWDYIRKVEAEGYDATNYWVDLFAKTAIPFICIIMSMVGTSIGVWDKIREGLPMCIVCGIGIAFLYWVAFSFCVSLGYGGMLPPIWAAWSTNFVFLCVGIFMLIKAE